MDDKLYICFSGRDHVWYGTDHTSGRLPGNFFQTKGSDHWRSCTVYDLSLIHIFGVQTTPDDFFQEDSIAISQIYRAKGNEAAIVYLINADLCARGINLSRKRNIIFTAMTRSKAWVRVSGIGDDMDLLIQEFNSVKERNFQLEFTYPDKSQRKNMRIIHRDMTQNELRDIRKSNSNLADITSKLANGEIRKEDLDEDTVNRLKDVLYN